MHQLGWKAPLVVGLVGGVAGVAVSLPALFLSASCCSGSMVPEESPLGVALRAICLPGSACAAAVDRSGGWLSFWVYCGGSFAAWGALAGLVSALFVALPRRNA